MSFERRISRLSDSPACVIVRVSVCLSHTNIPPGITTPKTARPVTASSFNSLTPLPFQGCVPTYKRHVPIPRVPKVSGVGGRSVGGSRGSSVLFITVSQEAQKERFTSVSVFSVYVARLTCIQCNAYNVIHMHVCLVDAGPFFPRFFFFF